MPYYRVSLRLRQPGRSWSYNWYALNSSATLALAAFRRAELETPLLNMHAPLTVLSRMSVTRVWHTSDPNPPREVARHYYTGQTGKAETATFPPDVVSTSAQVALVGATGTSRLMHVRGLDDGQVRRLATTGEDNPSPTLTSSINDLIDALASTGAQIRYRTGVGEAGYEWHKVKQLEPVPGTESAWTRVTTVDNHGLLAGQRVILSVRGQPQLEFLGAEYLLLAVTDTTLDIETRYRGVGTTWPVQGVRVRRLGALHDNIVARVAPRGARLGGFVRFSSRNTGMDRTAGARGRKAARKLRV